MPEPERKNIDNDVNLPCQETYQAEENERKNEINLVLKLVLLCTFSKIYLVYKGIIVSKTDWQIELLSYGEIVAERINFSIDENKFLMVFTHLDTINDESTLTQKAEDFGFTIPYNSFDVKFDRMENFESDNYYDSSNSKMNISQLNRLGEVIKQIMIFHYSIKNTEVYFATTERIELARYYDRLVRKYANQYNFEVIKIKKEGFDYAIKTPKFKGK